MLTHRVPSSLRTVCILAGMLLTLALSVGCASSGGLPLGKEGTLLRKIQDRGKLIVGVRYELPTFGYRNPQTNAIEGFEPALAREVAAYILGDPNKIEFKEAITQNRIPYLKDGTVDVVFSNFIISEERLKEVDFSIVYYVTGGTLLVPKGSSITSVASLTADKKVATGKGSAYIDPLKKLTPAEIVLFDTYTEATQAMLNNQVDAVCTNSVILLGMQLSFPNTQLVGGRFSTEYFAAGVAKNNPEFLEVINQAIKNIKTSGRWTALWKAEIGNKFGISALADPPADEWRK